MFKITLMALAASLAVSSAHAQTSINVGDIASKEGAARFEASLRKASNRLCSPYLGVARITCRNEVREEALSLLTEPQRLAYLRGQQENTRYASRGDQAS